MAETKYHFSKINKEQALDVQNAIAARLDQPDLIDRKTNKAIKAVVEELDQMNEDLNRYIAGLVREEAKKGQ